MRKFPFLLYLIFLYISIGSGPTVRIDEGETGEGGDGSESERPHVERLLSLGGQGVDKPFKPGKRR